MNLKRSTDAERVVYLPIVESARFASASEMHARQDWTQDMVSGPAFHTDAEGRAYITVDARIMGEHATTAFAALVHLPGGAIVFCAGRYDCAQADPSTALCGAMLHAQGRPGAMVAIVELTEESVEAQTSGCGSVRPGRAWQVSRPQVAR